ncbi:MAG: 16S rRNA (cytosine(1402)-N(4))-methyltransferase RsmH [Oscillospiraceae bacterium]|nr:16S rRNA (cytosine(1402)-N(4))-methyltransferase RsmH [Oscillospiraceae bacterium]
MDFLHKSVLLEETIASLNITPGGLYIDCTVGGGGHSLRIAQLGGRLICFDRDKQAIETAQTKLQDYPVTFINDNFSNMGDYDINEVDGILMDLGVSSYQLDNAERGFSFHEDAPLDMRMGDEGISAYDIVNDTPEDELIDILFKYGDEKYAFGIVRGIVKARELMPIRTTGQLAEIIRCNVPLSVRNAKNPCRKTFQAIRIAVNDELGSLTKGLTAATEILKSGGRLSVITFHSIEDRLVKQYFHKLAEGCICPKHLPICVCKRVSEVMHITRKPIIPSESELDENRRARSAKLRVIEKR